MGFIYIFLKIYPFLAISFGIMFYDLMRALKRKGNKAYLLMASCMTFCILTTGIWVAARGDKNADKWHRKISDVVYGR